MWLAAFAGAIALAVIAYPAVRGEPEPPPPRQSTDLVAPKNRSVGETVGPGAIMGELDLSSGNRAIVACRSGAGMDAAIVMWHLGPAVGGRAPELDSSVITAPGTGRNNCRACTTAHSQLGDERVLHGNCWDGGAGNITTAFVLATPTGSESPLALRVRCEGTRFEVDGSDLVLISKGHHTGSIADPGWYPEIRFRREAGTFVTDQEDLLTRNCDVAGSTQLAGLAGS